MPVCQFARARVLSYGVGPAMGKALLALLAVLWLALPLRAAGQGGALLAFGDSLTQGYGLPQDQGLVPQLQAWLRDHGAQVTVVNGGVSGDTTAGGAARIDWSLTPEIDAVMVTLGGNDMLRGIDPKVSRANLDTILTAIDRAGLPVLLVGMRAPGNYGADYKRSFDAMYADLAKQHGAQFFPDFFAGLGAGTPGDLAPYLQPDGLHPNALGVKRIVAKLGPAVLDLLGQVHGG